INPIILKSTTYLGTKIMSRGVRTDYGQTGQDLGGYAKIFAGKETHTLPSREISPSQASKLLRSSIEKDLNKQAKIKQQIIEIRDRGTNSGVGKYSESNVRRLQKMNQALSKRIAENKQKTYVLSSKNNLFNEATVNLPEGTGLKSVPKKGPS